MNAVVAALGIDPVKLLSSVGTIGLFLVIFAESGIMIGFFLPGDSLLFAAGLLSATTALLWPFPVLIVGCAVAAVVGDQVGYTFGQRVGPALFRRPDSRLFKQEHLARAEAFFSLHGSKTIILARFVPVVRTFAPIVAGASGMSHRTFTVFNVIGGVLWSTLLLSIGYALGSKFPKIGDYLDVAILIIVALSLLPFAIEYLRHRRARKLRPTSVAGDETD